MPLIKKNGKYNQNNRNDGNNLAHTNRPKFESMIIHEDPLGLINRSSKLCCSQRLAIAFLLGACTFILYAQRQSLNMTMLCMIDNKALTGELEILHNETCKVPFLSDFKEDDQNGPFAWKKDVQGVIIGSFYWGYCFQIFGGIIGARIGSKMALSIAVIVSSVSTILIPFTAQVNYFIVIVLRLLTGLAQGFIYPCSLPLISRWSTPTERSKLASFLSAGCSMGIIFATAISGPICSSGYWQLNFIIVALLGFFWLVPWWFLASNSPDQNKHITNKELNYLRDNSEKSNDINQISPRNWPLKSMLSSRGVWVIILTNVLSDFTLYGILSVFPSFLLEVFNIHIEISSYITACEYGLMWISTVLSGIISDHLMKSSTVSRLNMRKICNSIGMMIPAILFPIIGFMECSNYLIAIILLIFAGGLPGTYLSSGYLLNTVDIAGSFSGIVIGISNSLGSISGILAPYVANSMTQERTLIQWRLCFIVFSSVLFSAGLIFLLFSRENLESWAKGKNDSNVDKNNNDSEPNLNAGQLKNDSFFSDEILVPTDSYEENRNNFKNVVLVPIIDEADKNYSNNKYLV